MANSIIMPKAEMAMEEGVITKWLVAEGDTVSKGQPVVEIETDKSTMEVEADYEGVLLKMLHGEGETLPVTTVIAWVGEEGEEVPEPAAPAPRAEEAPAKSSAAKAPVATAAAPTAVGSKIPATPAAKRIAKEKGLSLHDIFDPGRTEPLKADDVLNYRPPVATASAIDQALEAPEVAIEEGDELVPMSNIQKTTARRMVQAQLTVPAVTLNADADVTELAALRADLKEQRDLKISFNDWVLKALATALVKFPELNSVFMGDRVLRRKHIHLSMAVATERGLLVPVIRDADSMSLVEVAQAAHSIAERGRAGELGAEAMAGGTFTVSNVGMFGIKSFNPVINLPQAAILGVCAIRDELKMVDGAVTTRKMMGLSLTFDHRAMDGAPPSMFMRHLCSLLENPLWLMT